YGAVEVDTYGPKWGKCNGGETIFMLLKGRVLKPELSIKFMQENTGWTQSVTFTKNGNCVYFKAPAYHQFCSNTKVDIVVTYQKEEIDRCSYTYDQTLDVLFAQMNLGEEEGSDTKYDLSNLAM
ncbi:unnamed protein product, partial [Didymodactylos carnosus]